MKIVRFILSVLITLLLITGFTEFFELSLVSHISDKSLEYLSANQKYYFQIRNESFIYYIKPIYTVAFAALATFLGCLIAKSQFKLMALIVGALQSVGIFYGMLFSQYADTLPTIYWLIIWLGVLVGIYLGTVWYKVKSI